MAKRKRKRAKGQSSKGTIGSRLSDGDRKLFAFLASFFTIVGFIVALILWKNDKYVMHYAKHGLILFIAQVVIVVLSPFLFFLTAIL
mgnify:CR=1 FL=1